MVFRHHPPNDIEEFETPKIKFLIRTSANMICIHDYLLAPSARVNIQSGAILV